MDIPSYSKEADRWPTAQLRNDSEVRKMEVDLPFVLGKLRNLLSVGELSKHKLLRDKIINSIEVLESISGWIEDPVGRKVSSDVIKSSLSKLPCSLNLIENEIDTFLVKKELPYRWGRKVLIKKKQILSSFLDNFVLSVDSDQFKRVENSEPKTKNILEEEEEEEASIPPSHDNMVEILKSSELGNQQHPRRRSTYMVANFKDAALIHAGECMQSGIQNDREMYSDAGVFNMSDRVYFEESENESDVVGHNEVKKKIYGRLLEVFEDNKFIGFGNNRIREKNRVIAVTGPAMFGKTTLVKMIYNHSSIEKLFRFRLWIQYPADLDVEAEDILCEILAQCERGWGNFNRHSSVEMMKSELKIFIEEMKYCLIVIDDVRTRNDYCKLQLVLQCISAKTRVIITTRDKDVASVASRRSEPLELQSLTEEESWILFLKKAVKPADGLNESDLENQKERVRKFDGSPKAIFMLANSFWSEEIVSQILEGTKNDTDVVGLHELKKLFLGRLMDQLGNNKTEVIAVTGPAGSGKTALMKMFCNESNFKQVFNLRVWFEYPADADVEAEDILENILRQCKGGSKYNRFSVREMKSMLESFLAKMNYYCLIVIDDVRTRHDFEKLQIVLQCTSVKTRVVITTRDMDVASIASPRPLQLRSLTDEESWTLFLKKTVIPTDGLNDSDLKKLMGRVRKCDGSPKAIIMLTGLLSLRDLTDFRSMIGQKELPEESILALSYQELPLPMKSCFLYLGLFPRAFQIPVRRLLHLWLAEGLVTSLPDQNMASEDVAEEYLNKLINRSMIEVARLRLDGRPKTCRMPGFLWDLFFPKAVTLGVFHVHNTTDYTSAERPEFNVRRLAEYVGIKTYPSSDPYYIQQLHSYISFNTRKRDLPAQEIGTFLNTIVTKRGFGLLRVLDLEGVYKPMLPEILKKFLHLKYLGLRWTFLDSLPLSTGTLPYLETLDVKHTNIITLPSSIWKAKNLRHLYMSEIHFDMSLQKLSGTGSLTNLRTLWGLYIGNKSLVYNCLNKLTALSKLGLTFNSTSVEAIADWISQLSNLQSLRLRSSNEFGQPAVLTLRNMTEHQKLSDLYLLGQLPGPICEHQLPPNLKILTLSASKLEEDPMPMLGKLTHLNILRLFGNSFTGKQITCRHKGFPQLRVLKLWMLEELEEWIVEQGTMPRLGELEIRRCIKLRQPEGLQLVPTLKDLILTNMPEAFVTNVKTVMNKSVFIQENNWSFAPLQV